jgi:hypothetical protein
MSMAIVTSSAARAADSLYYKTPSKGSTSGIIIGLCVVTLFSNLFGVRVCNMLMDRRTESILTDITADIR